jgi:RimJ/RimL family protein N-acetyltransferase
MSSPAKPLTDEFKLSTPRLIIHHLLPTTEHAQFFHELYNTPLFLAGQGKTGITTPDEALSFIRDVIPKFFAKNNHGIYLVSLLPSSPSLGEYGEHIGTVSLMRGDYALPDIGFALLPQYTHKGYATEAGKAMIGYAMKGKDEGGLGYEGVFGFTSDKNEKSQKACERLGLVFRGVYKLEAFGGGKSCVFTMPGAWDLANYGIEGERVDEV